MARWVDTHCHLQMLDDGDVAVASAADSEVGAVVCVGIDLDSSRAAVEYAHRHPGIVHATVGLHPHDATALDSQLAALAGLCEDPAVVAVGECGFDFYRDRSPRDAQERAFDAQVRLAAERDLALVVHTRDAWDATFALLERRVLPRRLVFHCFSGGPEDARRCVDLGAFLSVAGPVGYPKNEPLREAFRAVPLESLVVETDAPFLAPQRFRGKPNRPAWVAQVGADLAEALGLSVDDVAAATSANAARLFGLA